MGVDMVVTTTKAFRDATLGKQFEAGENVILSDELGATWIAIGVAEATDSIDVSSAPDA
jgi:hypothetical protein